MVGELGCQGVSDGGETTSLNQESVISYFRKVTHASCVTSCKYTHKENIIYQAFSCTSYNYAFCIIVCVSSNILKSINSFLGTNISESPINNTLFESMIFSFSKKVI